MPGAALPTLVVVSAVVGVVVAIAAAWAALVVVLYAAGGRRLVKSGLTALPHVAGLLRRLTADERVRRGARIAVIVALAWVVSPIDLIPEVIPVVGPLDDVIVVVLALRLVVKRAGRDVVAEHWRGDPAVLERLLRICGA